MSGKPRAYPPHWKSLSVKVRYERAQGQCECTGECGLHRTHPGPRRCEEMDRQPAKWAKGIVVLTVAHLNGPGGVCQCVPLCADPAHVKAMCQRCHIRYDLPRHVSNAARTRALAMTEGTLPLFEDTPWDCAETWRNGRWHGCGLLIPVGSGLDRAIRTAMGGSALRASHSSSSTNGTHS